MISLKKTIEAYDYRSMWQAALESYASAIESLEKHAVAFDHEGLNQYRASLHALKTKLESPELSPTALRDVAQELDAEIKRYRLEVEALLRESATDLKDVVLVLAEATESLSQRENLHGNQLSRISGSLEAISQIDDLAQVRITLNRQVHELRSCISNMARENETALAGLQKEIVSFQQKLEKVQLEASADPLTGAANRRRGIREITSRIVARRPFGVLLFDLNKFKHVNDTLGHAAGDLVLRLVCQRLSAHALPDSLVCRWGGDEFVVIQNGSPAELAASGKEICQQISGKFAIKVNGNDHQVSLGAEFGWADYRESETPEQLLARADKVLYGTKAPDLRLEAVPPQRDTVTALPGFESLENAIGSLPADRAGCVLACFAIRFAAKVNNHYGFAATDAVLPFLRDELRNSKFGSNLFRGRGASIVALVQLARNAPPLDDELRRICSIGLEKYLKQKRRASILPIAVAGKLFSVPPQDALLPIQAFVDQHRAAESLTVSASAARAPARLAAQPKP